jgi:hypothetical protein
MALRYILEPNEMNKDGSYFPRLVDRKHLSQDYLLELMSRRSAMNKQDLKLSLELLEEVLMDRLSEGDAVQTPLGVFSLVMSGGFSAQDSHLPSHHKDQLQLKVKLQPSGRMKDKIHSFSDFQLVPKKTPRPSVHWMKNLDRPEAEDMLPEEMTALHGQGLSKELEDQEAGAYFVDSQGLEYPARDLYLQNDRHALLRVPVIPTGGYSLVYRSRMRTQDLRSCDQPYPCRIVITGVKLQEITGLKLQIPA